MGLTFWGGGRIYAFLSAMHLPLSPEIDLLDANLIKRKKNRTEYALLSLLDGIISN
jgi:hypothetical protein